MNSAQTESHEDSDVDPLQLSPVDLIHGVRIDPTTTELQDDSIGSPLALVGQNTIGGLEDAVPIETAGRGQTGIGDIDA